MRIYNGTKSTLTLPYSGTETLTIAPKTPSGNVLCTNSFISTLITSYNVDEVAIIASGPFEITACANIPTAVNYVVQSLDEAIKRFNPVEEKPEVKEEEASPVKEEEPIVEEPVNEEPETINPDQEFIPVAEEIVKEETEVKKEKSKKKKKSSFKKEENKEF